MKKIFVTPLLLVTVVLLLCGFNGQSSTERKAQRDLPTSPDGIWEVLGKTEYDYDEQDMPQVGEFPETVKKLAGQKITISGFILPLEASEKFTHLILSRNPMTCGFCLPGGPHELIDVWLDSPIKWEDGMVKVSGTFELAGKDELGLLYKINHGKKL